jgi:hypothetical protein
MENFPLNLNDNTPENEMLLLNGILRLRASIECALRLSIADNMPIPGVSSLILSARNMDQILKDLYDQELDMRDLLIWHQIELNHELVENE